MRGKAHHVAMAAAYGTTVCAARLPGDDREREALRLSYPFSWLIDAIWLGLLLASKEQGV